MPVPASPIYTVAELDSLQHLKGKIGTIDVETMKVAVQIMELRRRFVHIDALVKPEAGTGDKWVALHKVKI